MTQSKTFAVTFGETMKITRVQYLCMNIIFGTMSAIVSMSQNTEFLNLFLAIPCIVAVFWRFSDIGMSWWWGLALFVPVLNFFPGFMLSFAPTGYNISGHDNFKCKDGWFHFGCIVVAASIATVLATLAFS